MRRRRRESVGLATAHEAFNKDASARVYRFSEGAQVSGAVIVGKGTVPADLTAQELVQ